MKERLWISFVLVTWFLVLVLRTDVSVGLAGSDDVSGLSGGFATTSSVVTNTVSIEYEPILNSFTTVMEQNTTWWDTRSISFPFVLYDNGTYKMWYSATPPAEYGPYPPKVIGYAESSDGVVWTNKTLVHDYGLHGSHFQTGSPWVMKEGGVYRMWHMDYYERVAGDWSYYISHMVSIDGIDWVNETKVLSALGQSGPQGDGYNVEAPCVIYEPSIGYVMWYSVADHPKSGVGGPPKIWRATSNDGVTWSNRQLSLPYIPNTWEENLYRPSVVKEDDGIYAIFYEAADGNGSSIGMAESIDGINWTNRMQLLKPSDLGVNITSLGKPFPFEDVDGKKYLYFTYYDESDGKKKFGRVLMGDWEDVEPPVADAGPDQSVIQGMTVSFNASGSTDDVGIRSYLWAFTDVTPKTLIDIQPRAQYTFNNVGDFEVTLNVTDYAGKQDTDTMWVHVSADTAPPVANAGPNQTVDEDTLVSFDGSGSTDNIKITSYTWTFIDMTHQTLTGVNPTYTFNTPREYIVTLNVTDTAGNWDTDTVQITVLDLTNPSIGVVLQEPDLPEEGDKITITVDVTDEGIGVHNVTLWYSTNEGATWTDFPMNRTTGDTYVGEILGLRAGTHVQYKVTAYDEAGNFASTTIQFLTVAKLNTAISISLSSSASYVGFKVEINGNLICNEVGLSGVPILLSYSVTSGQSWYDITLVDTASDGGYSALWMPSATGNYLVRATWAGNATYWGTDTTVNLAVIAKDQNVFSVESNSTISALAFDTTSWELSFTATGPNGTRGYTRVTVAKSLVENITNIRVYLDGNQLEYNVTSTDDSWLLTFTYTHSTHKVAVDLDINIIPEFPSLIILPLFMIATLLAVIIHRRKHTIEC